MPETKGVELPQTMEELSLYYEKNTLTPRKIIRIIRDPKELEKNRNRALQETSRENRH